MLSDLDIETLVAERPLTIVPFDRSLLRPSSYVLTLGERLLTGATAPARVEAFDDSPNLVARDAVDGRLTVEPGEFVLAGSREQLQLPLGVGGLLSLGSRLARLGLLGNGGATLVHAGFGHEAPATLTFELLNASRRPIELRVGMNFCHLILFRHRTLPSGGYHARASDRGVGPRPARFA